ncbi:MAG: hypothetical protein K6T29_03800 [Peptococcaceae bacterium]|nr:hypothetical protein [Peptococcaceae bacterium]
MEMTVEPVISVAAALAALLLLVFTVDWRHFRDWVVVFLYKCVLDSLWGTAAVVTNRIEFPYRQLPHAFKMSLLFDFWVFPVLCILYNQVTRERGLWPVLYQALLFSAVITAMEYPLERYTQLIKYLNWSWLTTFFTLTVSFLSSRAFIAFYRWGCAHFGKK